MSWSETALIAILAAVLGFGAGALSQQDQAPRKCIEAFQ